MSQESKKHYIKSEAGSPLRQAIEYIKSRQGESIQQSFEDWAVMMHYPHALYQSGASFEQVVFQANAAICRHNQEIQAMNTLINMMAIAEGKPPIVPSYSPVLGMTSEGMVAAEAPPEVTDPSNSPNGSKASAEAKKRTKYFDEPF